VACAVSVTFSTIDLELPVVTGFPVE